MAGATTTTLDALVMPVVHQEVSDAVFRNSDFLPLFQQIGPVGGGTYDIKVITAPNTSAQVFVEGQVDPEPNQQQIVTAAAPWKSFRVFTRITGHARREMNAPWESMAWPNSYGGQNLEQSKAVDDLIDIVNTTFLDTSASGVQGIIDATTAYYDLSRSTYTALKSYEKAISAHITLAALDRLEWETYNQPYGGRIELIVLAPAQARSYSGLVHGKLALPTAGDPGGGGLGNLPPFNDIPVVAIRDLAATVALGFSGLSSGGWFFVLHEQAPGGIDIQELSFQNDAKTMQLETSGALICTRPNEQGKLTGLGTT
jgi:hypothetical protein